MTKLGISTYTYTWAVGVPGSTPERLFTATDLVDRAFNLGVNNLQIADNYPLSETPEDELIELRDYAQARNIQIEIGGRGLQPNNLERYLELAVLFNSPLLRMVIDANGFEPQPEEVVQIIRNILPQLIKSGIVLALENHDRLHSSVFMNIVESINHPLVGICLDSVNSMGIGEGLETVVTNLAPYTVNLHVKDYTVYRVHHKMGFVVEGTPAGKGMLNLPWIIEKLKPYNKCHSAILELWTPPENDIEMTIIKEHLWATQSIEYMKSIFTNP